MKKIKLTKDAIEGLLDNLLKRSPNNYGQYTEAVDAIVSHVKKDGDAAPHHHIARDAAAHRGDDGEGVDAEQVHILLRRYISA